MHSKYLVIAILFSALLIDSISANAQGSQNFQWFQYYVHKDINKQLMWKADAGYRFRNFFGETSQYITRTSLGLKIGSSATVSAGFSNLGYYSSSNLDRYEWRPYVEYSIVHGSSKLKLDHRFRLEYRHFRDIAVLEDASPVLSNRFRPRYRFMLSFPLKNARWQLNAGNEIFLHRNIDQEDKWVFNQNRLLVGPEYEVSEKVDVSLTMNFQLSGQGQGRYRNDYVFWFALKHRLN